MMISSSQISVKPQKYWSIILILNSPRPPLLEMNYIRKLFLNVFTLGILSNISGKKSQNYGISVRAFHTTVFHDETGQCEKTLFT